MTIAIILIGLLVEMFVLKMFSPADHPCTLASSFRVAPRGDCIGREGYRKASSPEELSILARTCGTRSRRRWRKEHLHDCIDKLSGNQLFASLYVPMELYWNCWKCS